MPEFEPTIPFGQPELMRASGFTRYLDELGRDAPEGAPSTRLSSLSPSLTQDLMRFEQGGREPALLDVLAAWCATRAASRICAAANACCRSAFRATVAHCALDLQALITWREPLPVLQVEPAVLRAPGDAGGLVGEPRRQPLAPLCGRSRCTARAICCRITGAAVSLAPTLPPALTCAAWRGDRRLRLSRQRDIAGWPEMNNERANRLLNALYLQAGLIISRSHPAALGDSWFRSIRAAQ
jgi:hypothetical protein